MIIKNVDENETTYTIDQNDISFRLLNHQAIDNNN